LVARIGVRPQLSLVALVAIFPLLALLIVGVVKSRQLILEAATTRALDLARLAAERQDDSFKDAKNVLTVIRRLPQVTAASPENCRAALQAIGADYPQFTSLGVVDANGMASCINIAAKPVPFADMDIFRAATAADPSAFVVGRFMIGPITGKPIVVAAAPLASSAKDEPPPGIVFVSVDLNRAAQHVRDFADQTDATLSLIDSHAATILFRSSDQQHLAGKALDGSPLIQAMLGHPTGGTVETADVDGTPRIFGFAPLDVGGGVELMAAVGLSRAQVMGAADRRLVVGFSVAILTALLAAAAAWFVGDRMQLGAIRSLVEAAKKLGAGDLAARADMAAWQAPEFRALADTLGDMAKGIALAQANLASSERQLRLLADNSTDMILLVREDGRRLYASPACRALLGFEPEEMLQISSKDAIHPEDAVLQDRRRWREGDSPVATYRMRRKDGGYVWVESVARAVAAQPGQPLQRVVVVRDIDQRLAAERRIKESETRYRLLAEHSTDMVFQLDRQLVRRYVSPACREILGYEPEELVGAQPLAMVHPDDVERLGAICQFVLRGVTERAAIVYRMRHRDGRWIWVEAQLRTLNDPEGGAASGMMIGALRDISQRKAAEDQLEEANRRLEALAGQDGLTGLANRRIFDDALAREHRRAVRDRTRLAMIMIDVDRFKPFNDRYGHPAGDQALRRVSRAIEGMLRRPGDVAARYGGEEFAVLLPGADESGAAIIADRIRRAVLALAIEHDESPAGVVTVSAGVASVAPGAFDASLATLVADADRALYRAKANGRNAIVYASALADAIADGRSSAA
jgi:diguanylate cyclase (GGDEF)-like protein/PAS domain S-box-containing protein